MKAQYDHTQDNRITPQVVSADQGYSTRIVECVRLDDEISASGQTLFIKVDTQGAEPEVLSGAKRLLEENRCCLVIEFMPMAYFSRLDPMDYLEGLHKRFVIVDIGQGAHQFNLIDKDISGYVKSLSESERQWTDLMPNRSTVWRRSIWHHPRRV